MGNGCPKSQVPGNSGKPGSEGYSLPKNKKPHIVVESHICSRGVIPGTVLHPSYCGTSGFSMQCFPVLFGLKLVFVQTGDMISSYILPLFLVNGLEVGGVQLLKAWTGSFPVTERLS